MSDDKYILYLNYSVFLSGNEDTSVGNIVESGNISAESRSSVKEKIRRKLDAQISSKFGSVGSNYHSQSNSDLYNSYRGGNSVTNGAVVNGKLRVKVGIRTTVDAHCSLSEGEIWSSLKETADGTEITVDRKIFGSTSSFSEGTFVAEFREPISGRSKYAKFSGENQLESSLDSYEGNRTAYPEAFSGVTKGDFNHEEYLEDLKEEISGHITQIRKPTQKDFVNIMDEISSVVSSITMEGDTVYLEETPDYWDKITCSRCNEKKDTFNLNKSKYYTIMRKQMKSGFGISSDANSREMIESEISNFLVDKNGNVYFNPEEMLSWIVEICQYVEPYCEECHREIGGNQSHDDMFSITETKKGIKSKQIEENDSEYTYNGAEDNLTYDPGQKISIDAENTTLDKFRDYRNPTRKELEEVREIVSNYILLLCTREDNSYRYERSKIYRYLMNRGELENQISSEEFRCKKCSTRIGDRDLGYKGLERHHPDPQKLKQLKIKRILNEMGDPIVLVDNNSNHYILTDRFFRIIESIVENLDTLALVCESCDREMGTNFKPSNENQIKIDIYSQDNEQDVNQEEKYVPVEVLARLSLPNRRYEDNIIASCAVCKENFTVDYNKGGGYYVSPSPTPIVPMNKIPSDSSQAYVGLCSSHIDVLDEYARNFINYAQIHSQRPETVRKSIIKTLKQIYMG